MGRVPGEGDREAMMDAGREEDLLGRVDDEDADVGDANMSSRGRIAGSIRLMVVDDCVFKGKGVWEVSRVTTQFRFRTPTQNYDCNAVFKSNLIDTFTIQSLCAGARTYSIAYEVGTREKIMDRRFRPKAARNTLVRLLPL